MRASVQKTNDCCVSSRGEHTRLPAGAAVGAEPASLRDLVQYLRGLDPRTYSPDQLPQMPASTPPLVSRLLKSVLSPLPSHRPRPRTVASVLQLLVWAPSTWYRQDPDLVTPSTQDILQWLLTMATKVECDQEKVSARLFTFQVLCESRWGDTAGAAWEYQMVATFLVSTGMGDIREALDWIHENTEDM